MNHELLTLSRLAIAVADDSLPIDVRLFAADLLLLWLQDAGGTG